VVGGDAVEAELQDDDQDGEGDAEDEADEGLAGERFIGPAGPCESEDDQGAKQDEPHEKAFRGRSVEPAIDEGNEAEGVTGESYGPI
jgi:hypothetical protein